MKRWFTIAVVLVLSTLLIAAEQGPRPDAPRPEGEMMPPVPERPDRPAAIERIGNMLRQQQERLERLEQQQNRLMERLQARPGVVGKPAAPRLVRDARPISKPAAAKAARPMCQRHECKGFFGLVLLICTVVHILAAVWVFQDIRARGAGSGLWIVITLLAGLFAVLVYAVVRLGDVKKT